MSKLLCLKSIHFYKIGFQNDTKYPLFEDMQQYKAITTREFEDQKAALAQHIKVLEEQALAYEVEVTNLKRANQKMTNNAETFQEVAD